MINKYDCCFLSRPRRFGKTLLIKTLEELFLGNHELFEGLWIDTDSDYAFQRHPVLKLSMAYSKIYAKDDLEARIESDLMDAAEIEDVKITANSYGEMLGQFLKGVNKKYGVGGVILIDEYDAPVARHISNRKLAADNREVLHDFYTSIKRNIDFIRFALVTGISRFTMTALDSGPNNFVDISLMPDYAAICGFTISELDELFSDRFKETLDRLKSDNGIDPKANEDTLKAMISEWYDGYSWLGPERVLNPYSILNFFDQSSFDDYWTMLGVPSLLSALVRERPMEFIQPSLDSYTSKQIRKIELGGLDVAPVLFHSGYLTIDGQVFKDVIIDGKPAKVKALSFRIPNREVGGNYQSSFFMQAFDPDNKYFTDFTANLPKALSDKNSSELARLLGILLASITFYQHDTSESYYHSVIHAAFIAAGIDVMSETPGAHGRADMAVFLNDRVRVAIELKYRHANPDEEKDDPAVKAVATKELAASLDDAERQMTEGEYGESLRAISNKVICLALAIRGRTQVAARFVDIQSMPPI
jgi:hypothetical protein